MPEARYYHLEAGKVRCELCPRHCLLGEGQKGLCGVRHMQQGKLWTDVYGGCSSLCVDPIEKKPFYHLKPGSKSLSLGTLGCTLSCAFCQNHHISQPQFFVQMESISISTIIELAHEHTCQSVALTYNEPIVSIEWSLDIARACRKAGLLSLAVTSGHIDGNARQDFFEVMDGANVDLKAFNADFYKRYCHGSLDAVLESLIHLSHTKTWLEITTLLIPGLNDGETEIHAMTEWIFKHLGPNVPLHLSAFHPQFEMQDRAATPLGTLQNARAIAKQTGLKHVYIGNVYDKEGQNTYCPGCGELLVERNGFKVLKNSIQEGCCPKCKTVILGIF